MKRLITLLVAIAALTYLGSAQASFLFEADLSGAQEVPPVETTASGVARLELDDAQTRLEMSIELFGLDLTTESNPNSVVGTHIHRGVAGENGPIVFGLINPNSDLNGDLVIDEAAGTLFSAWDTEEGNETTLAAELSNLFAEGLYLNIHTPAFPAGEIRGQIRAAPVPEPSPLALIAVGIVLVVVGRVTKRL